MSREIFPTVRIETQYLIDIGYEVVTGETIFVDNRAAPIFPVPLAHGVGAVVGAAFALTDSRLTGRIIRAAHVASDRAAPSRALRLVETSRTIHAKDTQ